MHHDGGRPDIEDHDHVVLPENSQGSGSPNMLDDILTRRVESPGGAVDARHAQRQDQADQRQRQDQLK